MPLHVNYGMGGIGGDASGLDEWLGACGRDGPTGGGRGGTSGHQRD